jgi:hypothetical protein
MTASSELAGAQDGTPRESRALVRWDISTRSTFWPTNTVSRRLL